MAQVTIQSGPFAGNTAELIEAGEGSSKLKVSLFGRPTVIDAPNDSFTVNGEAAARTTHFDKDASHDHLIRWDREAVASIFNQNRDVSIEVRGLDTLPGNHSWRQLVGLAPAEAIRQQFASLLQCAPRWVDAFADALRAIYTMELEGQHVLLYACEKQEGSGSRRRSVVSLLVGGPSLDSVQLGALDERLSEYALTHRWQVPGELRAFYAIHHGFGRVPSWGTYFDAGSIYPTDLLSVLGELMSSIAKEQAFVPDGYGFDDLLTFFDDGAGNRRSFFRREAGVDPIGVVDWDHETREIGDVTSFWDFLEDTAPSWWFGQR